MKSVNVPKFFHEVFGKKSTVLELFLSISFSIAISIFLLTFTYLEWKDFETWKIILIMLLALDITGGVIANFTLSTNNHYKAHPKARLIFILMHVQPMLLALLLWNYFVPCSYVWAYTVVSALIVNALLKHPAQKTIAAVLAAIGSCTTLIFFTYIPKFLLIILLLYIIKVVFSFAVDHYSQREV